MVNAAKNKKIIFLSFIQNKKTAKSVGKTLVHLILLHKQKKQWLWLEISMNIYK